MSNPARSEFPGSSPDLADTGQTIWPLLLAWAHGCQPSLSQRQKIEDWELACPRRAAAWQLSADNVTCRLEDRAALLQAFCQKTPESDLPLPGRWTDWIVPLWTLWLPLAQQLAREQQSLGTPFIQGILGGQGTGKTTLTKILRLILGHLGHQTVALSIDDLYLTYAQRCKLRRQDPRLIWRGPPGTHDIELGRRTLTQLRHSSAGEWVTLPQFDKSLHQGEGDRTHPITLPAPTIVLFEGWFVGARPLDDAAFNDERSLPEPISTPADRQFARDSNRRLHSYLPLWAFLDRLIVLAPSDYRLSQKWRRQAERQMSPGQMSPGSGLSDDQIEAFVTYFWKALHPELFITPAIRSPNTGLVVKIGQDHRPAEVYSPSAGHAEPM